MVIQMKDESTVTAAIERGRRLSDKFGAYVVALANRQKDDESQFEYVHIGFEGQNSTQLNVLENLFDKPSHLVGACDNVYNISCGPDPHNDNLCTFEPVTVHVYGEKSGNLIDISDISSGAEEQDPPYRVEVDTMLQGDDVVLQLVAVFSDECRQNDLLGTVTIKRYPSAVGASIRLKDVRKKELKFGTNGKPEWSKLEVELKPADELLLFIDVEEVIRHGVHSPN